MNGPQYNTFSHVIQINSATEVFKRYLNKFNHRKIIVKEKTHKTQIILKL